MTQDPTAPSTPWGAVARTAADVGLALGAGLLHVALFLGLVVATRGAGWGWVAVAGALAVTTAVLARRRRRAGAPRRPRRRALITAGLAVAALLTASVGVPTAALTWSRPADLPADPAASWALPTGSRVAVYHDAPPRGAGPGRPPLVFLAGGPVRGLSLRDHATLHSLADRGWDVWAPEPAGGGRSDPLPLPDYSVDRSVTDTVALLRRIGQGRPVDVVGFSSGAVVLTRLLARPDAPTLVRRAVIAEPGPVDGPTAALPGSPGRPSASGLAHLDLGPASTRLPRYAVGLGLAQAGLLPPVNGLLGQDEATNAFAPGDLAGDTVSGYCAADAGRIPVEDSPANFRFNPLASLRVQDTIRSSPSIDAPLRAARVPAMVLLAECSHQRRSWETHVIQTYGALERVQYLPDVGHHLWNPLGDDTARADAVVTAFLDGAPAPLPDGPRPSDVPAFLAAGR